MLAGFATADTRVRLTGTDAIMPVAIAPMAYQRRVHEEGELAAARAARAGGVPYIVSTLSSYCLEDVAATGVASTDSRDG
ncbi:alpha-hydroxy-acid oxidizing protein [Streptomyces caniferus]|uniref:alpha-hydroxy-acid oxidizing protein n=1 Tax=Streptomyces caniferus TaxID=285557 RepID=UPI0038232C9F